MLESEFTDVAEFGFYSCDGCDLRFFFPAVTGSEAYYARLKEFDWYYLDQKPEYQIAARFIGSDDRVLDVGCGTGAFSRGLTSNQYVGLELSTSAAAEAAVNGVTVLNQTVEEHAVIHSEEYDAVCAFQVLEHVKSIDSFLEASLSCLRPGGILIVSVPSADSFVADVPNYLLNMPPHHVSWWTDACLTNVARLFGLQLERLEHDALSPLHEQLYEHTVWFRRISAISGAKWRLVDDTRRAQINGKLASFLRRSGSWGLKRREVSGHSVTAVYRKRASDGGDFDVLPRQPR